ncbi:hypothetical protein C8Q80DRAFT_1225497, partial [Daedaleopsis nitida]
MVGLSCGLCIVVSLHTCIISHSTHSIFSYTDRVECLSQGCSFIDGRLASKYPARALQGHPAAHDHATLLSTSVDQCRQRHLQR